MGQEHTPLLCPECKVPGESDPKLTRWQCNSCGNAFYLRRCSACAGISYVDGLQGFRMPWPCIWCGEFNRDFRPNRDPAAATAAELAADVARYGPPRSGARPVPGDQASPGLAADSAPRDPGDRGLAPAAPASTPGVAPPPGQAEPPRDGRRPVRYIALLIAVVAAGVAAASVLVAETGSVAAGMPHRTGGQGGVTRAVRVAASRVGRIEFQGVPGQLTIVGTDSGQVTLTGQVHGTRAAPAVETGNDGLAGVLVVSIRCAPASPCTQNLRLAVPAGTATTVRQDSGQIVVTGLAGPLNITAAHVNISASALRSPDLAATITSGHLSATFAAPPSQVAVTLTAAQATLRLPAGAAYRITREVTSGYVRVAIPQSGTAARSVTARIDSGELELLPA